jgi:hypothetical protein
MALIEIELKNFQTDQMIVVNENGSVEASLGSGEEWDQEHSPLISPAHETDSLLASPINEIRSRESPRKNKLKHKCFYFVDVVFSAFVSSPLSGYFWYSIWKFTENYVHIYNRNMSFFFCYFLGFFVLAMAYLLQDFLEEVI